MREAGYYWCRIGEYWSICEFIFVRDDFGEDENGDVIIVPEYQKGVWDVGADLDGNTIEENDNYFDEIDEKQIKRE